MAASIESVINQTYQNWELIIVNDCSTDDTLEIAQSNQRKDPRIRVFCNEKNLKLPLTLNASTIRGRPITICTSRRRLADWRGSWIRTATM